MSDLANLSLRRPLLVVAFVGAFMAQLAGCATTARPPSNASSSHGIGISVISQSASILPIVVDSTRKRATDSSGSMDSIFKGWGSFGPGALLVIPFALGYDALRSAALSTTCEADLNSTYPGAAEMFHSAVQREIERKDILDGFMEPLQNRSSDEVVPVAIPAEKHDIPTTQQLLDIAAQRRLGRLLVVEVLSVELGAMDALCEHWAFRVNLRVSLWSVSDGERIAGPVLTSPFTPVTLNALRALIEEPGAVRSRLAPNFRISADEVFEHANLFH